MMSLISFVKLIDVLIGRLLCHILPNKSKYSIKQNLLQILVIRPGGIGDAVLLLPALAAIYRLLPEVEIHVLAERRNSSVFKLSPYISQIYCYDRPSEIFKAVKGDYDIVIDTEQWHRLSCVIAWLTGAPVLAGFATNERRRLLNIPVDYSQTDHEAFNFTRLASSCFPNLPDVPLPDAFLLPAQALGQAQTLLSTMSNMQRFVAFFPGASVPEKKWPVPLWRSLVQEIAQLGLGVVLVGGKDTEEIAGIILDGVQGINATGRLTLVESAALLSQVQLLISGDSGVLHLAWLMNIPTVSLFGPSNSFKWAPQGNQHTVINKNLTCSPCTTFGTTPPCPYNARCMQEITVDEVVTHCLKQLEHPAG